MKSEINKNQMSSITINKEQRMMNSEQRMKINYEKMKKG